MPQFFLIFDSSVQGKLPLAARTLWPRILTLGFPKAGVFDQSTLFQSARLAKAESLRQGRQESVV